MIISINAKRAFDKIQHLFLTKNSQQNKNKKELMPHDKGHPKKNLQLTSYLNGERLDSFPLRSETKDVHCPLLLYIVLEFLAKTIRQEKSKRLPDYK